MSSPLEASPALTSSTGLPLINQALEPASVRNGSPATQKAYASALDFEQMLVQQLSKSMVATSGLEESGEQGFGETAAAEGSGEESLAGMSAANSELTSQLPQTLTEGVMAQGGLGLAQQLMTQLEPAAAATATTGAAVTAGGTAPGIATAGGVGTSVLATSPTSGTSRVANAPAAIGASGGTSA